MLKQMPIKTIDSVKVVVFKTLRDGALLLDQDDRVLFIKAHDIDMGTAMEAGTIMSRLIEPKYEHQFAVFQIAKPRLRWTLQKWVKDIKQKIYAYIIALRQG